MLEELKDEVAKLLMLQHDYEADEAHEAVLESVENDPTLWHEEASIEDLAKYVASEEDSE